MPRRIYAADYYQGLEHDHRPVVDVYINQGQAGWTGGLTDQFFADEAPRLRWAVAYRAARLACRGVSRLHLAEGYGSERHERVAERVTKAVAHSLGYEWSDTDDGEGRAGDLYCAAIHALGGPSYISIDQRHPLDFERHARLRTWVAEPTAEAA